MAQAFDSGAFDTGAFEAGSGGPPSQTLTQSSRFDNTNTFHSPTVGRGAVTLSPARLDNAQAFYAPTLGRGAVTLAPGLLVNVNEIYAPEVSAAGLPPAPPVTPSRKHADGRRGYIFKGKRYWLNHAELAQLIREEQARIQDVQRIKRNKPKTISAETAKAIEAIIASLNLPVEKPQVVEVREVVEYDDDDEAIELLMTL